MSYPVIEGFRLSPAQHHLWLRQGHRVGPYRICAAVSVTGRIDPARIEAGLRSLTERHEALRTTYSVVPGMKWPVQIVRPEAPWSFAFDDLREMDGVGHARAVEAACDTLAGTAIDLERGPVWRSRLLARSDAEATLVLMWPSLVADADSVLVAVQDLARLVDGDAGDASGGDAPMQPVDVAEWQRELLEADGTAAGREFWRQIDADALARCRLALGRTRRAEAFVLRTMASALPSGLGEGASRWASAHGRTVQDVLLAAWLLLMWRLTDRSDLIVGIGANGRSLADLAGVVGPLARTLPVRCSIEAQWSFADLVEASHGARADHARWESLFAWDARDGSSDGDLEPYCPLAFDAFDWTPIGSGDATRWTIERVEGCADRVELGASFVRTADGWVVRWTHDERVHTAAQVASVADQYVAALRAAVATEHVVVSDIDIRGDAERRDARAVSPTIPAAAREDDTTPFRSCRCIHHVFEEQAAATSHREAVVCAGDRLTYAELNARADRIAGFLRAHGVGPEARVGLFLEHSTDLLAATLAILKAGGAFVPLPPEQPVARLARLVEQVGASIVISHSRLAAGWPPSPSVQLLRLDEDAVLFADPSPVASRVRLHSDNAAYVMFTSGSTGEPKGVVIPHGALAQYVGWSRASYLPDRDVSVLLHSSIGFDATLTSLLMPLCGGARVIVAPDALGIDTLARTAALPDRLGFLKVTPAHLQVVAGSVAEDRLASLTGTLVIGGEALDAEHLGAWRAHAPATRIVNEYGPTEAAVGCVVHHALAGSLDAGPVPIGHPVAGVTCHALDAFGRPAAVGVTGELYIGGAQLARGYEGRPDLTAERFLPNPFAAEPGARCYRTGDLVRVRSDGAFEYVGRRDRQVKLRGYRIELGEVEAALRQQPGIRDAVVVLREDSPGERRLVAYVVPTPETSVASDRVRLALSATLPDFLVPAVIVTLDALPLTANGKVDRRRLPVPDGRRPMLTQAYVAPRTALEATLARIWADVLRLDRVGIHDNFFALGGDSILSLQIAARAARAGVRLAPRLVFEHPTVETLAASARGSIGAPVDQGPVTGAVPLTPIQHWFFEQPLDERHHYNQALALEVTQPGAHAVLADAWLRLQVHHDALRLRYARGDDGWQQIDADLDQVVAPTAVDLSAVVQAHRERTWALVARAVQKSLDLERGPLARAALIEWGPHAPSRLLIVLHHVACDGVSWRVLLEDLQELCRRDRSGAAAALPPKTTSFKGWAEKLSAFTAGGGFDRELPFWTAMSEPSAVVARDRPAAHNTVASQRTVAIALGVEETDALLHRLPVSLDVHVQEVVLAALVTALARRTGGRTWKIDVEGHGREALEGDEDVSRTVGWFTCVYPLRVDAPPGDDPLAALRSVRAAVRRVPRYGVGYGALRHLRTDAAVQPLGKAAASEIIFNYWGQLDQVFASSAWVRPAAVPLGPPRARRQDRSYVFEISASVVDARLQIGWTYSINLHEPQTIDQLAGDLRDAVSRLAALPDEARATLKTPADFPLAAIAQLELDRIVAEGGPVADIYPLSPLQEGLLFRRLLDSEPEAYTQQFAAHLVGPLDPLAFRRAWDATVERHDVLRTGFVWQRRDRPLQVVRDRAAIAWTVDDWRGIDSARQDARLQDHLDADRHRGFDVERPPLMRVGLIRLADDRWHVLWTSHHLVLDGWSMPIVIGDVLRVYAAVRDGRPAWTEPPAARYADYIAWLQRQDGARAEAFWRRTLDGLRAPTIVAAPRRDTGAAGPLERETLRAAMPASLVGGLQRLGSSHGITMNSWFAGAWALLLAHCTRRDDVVFGAVVSGRPADLAAVEAIAGVFVNTLPLRTQIAPTRAAIAWFAECQRRQVEAREYEYASLARIQGWSALPAGTALFDTLFVYENYPVEQAWRGQTELRLERASAAAWTSFPLGIQVAGSGSDIVVTIDVDRARVPSALGRFVRDGFEAVLSRVVAEPDGRVGTLLERLDELALGPDSNGVRQLRGARQQSLQALKRTTAAAAARPYGSSS